MQPRRGRLGDDHPDERGGRVELKPQHGRIAPEGPAVRLVHVETRNAGARRGDEVHRVAVLEQADVDVCDLANPLVDRWGSTPKVFDFIHNAPDTWRRSNGASKQRILRAVSLNRTLGDVSVALDKR